MIHSASFAALAVGSLALVAPVLAQDLTRSGSDRAADTRCTVCVVLEGVVLGEGGDPVAGAEVASGAGGRGVTGLDGGYRLEVEVPLEAESVEVTATAGDLGASLSLRTDLGLCSAPLVTPVDPLT